MNKNKNRIIAGIELGSSKITTIVGQVQSDLVGTGSNINVVGVSSSESKGIKKGQIVNLEEAVEATISSVEAAERMAGYNLSSAYVALGGAHILSQNSHGVVAVSTPEGEITYEDVNRVIEAASAISLPSSREVIHVIPREFLVDGESGVRDAIGMSGVRLEVETHIITASQAAIRNVQKVINEVGINLEEFVFVGLAAAESTLTDTEKELGCVLIDVGGGTTSVAAYTDGAITSSFVLPIGAKNVTNDLAIGLRLSLESAEKIKIVLSDTGRKNKKLSTLHSHEDQIDLQSLGVEEDKKVSKKTLVEGIIKPRLNEIFTMVKLQLDKEKISARVPSGAIITGGGANIVGVEEAAKRSLSLPARIGIPTGFDGLIDDVSTPAYATSLGLISHGAKNEPNEHLTRLGKKLKLPSKGVSGKLIQIIKDLLP